MRRCVTKVLVVLVCLLLGGCSSSGSKEVGSDGEPIQPTPVLAALHPGYARQGVEDRSTYLLEEAVERNGTLRVMLVNSSVAGSMAPVKFSEKALHGTFVGKSKNPKALDEELKEARLSAQDELNVALSDAPLDEGADLLGALKRLVDEAQEFESFESVDVYLVTGGGLIRTPTVDLADPTLESADWAPVIEELVEKARIAEIKPVVEISGVNNFSDGATPPSKDIRDQVDQFWSDVCKSLTEEGIECSQTSVLG